MTCVAFLKVHIHWSSKTNHLDKLQPWSLTAAPEKYSSRKDRVLFASFVKGELLKFTGAGEYGLWLEFQPRFSWNHKKPLLSLLSIDCFTKLLYHDVRIKIHQLQWQRRLWQEFLAMLAVSYHNFMANGNGNHRFWSPCLLGPSAKLNMAAKIHHIEGVQPRKWNGYQIRVWKKLLSDLTIFGSMSLLDFSISFLETRSLCWWPTQIPNSFSFQDTYLNDQKTSTIRIAPLIVRHWIAIIHHFWVILRHHRIVLNMLKP